MLKKPCVFFLAPNSPTTTLPQQMSDKTNQVILNMSHKIPAAHEINQEKKPAAINTAPPPLLSMAKEIWDRFKETESDLQKSIMDEMPTSNHTSNKLETR